MLEILRCDYFTEKSIAEIKAIVYLIFFSVFRYSSHKYIQTLLSTFTTVLKCVIACCDQYTISEHVESVAFKRGIGRAA